MENIITPEKGIYSFLCPHCGFGIEVLQNQVNCQIFRHAAYFTIVNGAPIPTHPINPHTPKNLCDQLVKEGKVLGCAKPFKMIQKGARQYTIQKCDYI